MGAHDVLKVLKKNKNKKLTLSEIDKLVDINIRSIKRILHNLLQERDSEICVELLEKEKEVEKYNHSLRRQVRVYWAKN